MTHTYQDADQRLTGRCRERRKVANNTWLERRPDGKIAVRLHDTDIVTYHPDEAITLDSGGWLTVTTKARMNDFTPFHIWSDRGEWSVGGVPFVNGMTWRAGEWSGIDDAETLEAKRAATNKIRRDIKAFVDSITPEQIVAAFDNTTGDCFICRAGQTSCLESHVEEHYFHAHLALRAAEAAGYRSPQAILGVIYHYAERGVVEALLKRVLSKYLKSNLMEGVATR